jgi:hypothetical protein
MGEEEDFFVCCVGPDEPGVECVPPQQEQKSADDEQGSP